MIVKSTPPQLLIVPGSYTSALAYHSIRDILRKTRPDLPEAIAYDLPTASSGPPLPPPTLYDDGAFFAEKITELADQALDVILFAHSYGGLVAREAMKGLSKAERTSQGKTGGVVRIIYLSSVICEPGEICAQVLANVTFDFLDPFDEHYARHIIPISAARVFSDLPRREAVRHAARATVHAIGSFMNPVTELSEFDKQIPSTFLFCTKDEILPPDFQRERIEILKKQSGEDRVQVIELETGHCPNASAPEKVVAAISDVLLSTK